LEGGTFRDPTDCGGVSFEPRAIEKQHRWTSEHALGVRTGFACPICRPPEAPAAESTHCRALVRVAGLGPRRTAGAPAFLGPLVDEFALAGVVQESNL
jgi:hypothetical protein